MISSKYNSHLLKVIEHLSVEWITKSFLHLQKQEFFINGTLLYSLEEIALFLHNNVRSWRFQEKFTPLINFPRIVQCYWRNLEVSYRTDVPTCLLRVYIIVPFLPIWSIYPENLIEISLWCIWQTEGNIEGYFLRLMTRFLKPCLLMLPLLFVLYFSLGPAGYMLDLLEAAYI